MYQPDTRQTAVLRLPAGYQADCRSQLTNRITGISAASQFADRIHGINAKSRLVEQIPDISAMS